MSKKTLRDAGPEVTAALKQNSLAFVEEAAPRLGVAPLCRALGVSRATLYRRRDQREGAPISPRPTPPRALTASERDSVLGVLNNERFADTAPTQVWATLLEEGTYLCSPRTMYRILAQEGQVRERRDQLTHPAYVKPELLATAPNQLWSWDITKLRGPSRWVYYHLYVILDVFSRYVTGWMVAEAERDELAVTLIEAACARQGIQPGQLTIHADRGASMRSKLVAQLLVDLSVEKTHSRPHVSDDNPFSEAQFKTLKYRPDYPDRFGSPQHARSHGRAFFHWYNHVHHHSGIAWMTPADVHYGRAEDVTRRRAAVLELFARGHPERFVNGPARPPRLPEAVWINKPAAERKPEKGGYQDMDRSIISRHGTGQGPNAAAAPPLFPFSPHTPLFSFSPPEKTSPATRGMFLEDLH